MAGFQPTYSTNDFNNGNLPSKKLVTGGFLALKIRNFSSKTMMLTDTVSDGTDQPFPIDTINPWTLKHLILEEGQSFVYIQPVPNGPVQAIDDPYFTNQRVDYGLDNIAQVYESDLSAGMRGLASGAQVGVNNTVSNPVNNLPVLADPYTSSTLNILAGATETASIASTALRLIISIENFSSSVALNSNAFIAVYNGTGTSVFMVAAPVDPSGLAPLTFAQPLVVELSPGIALNGNSVTIEFRSPTSTDLVEVTVFAIHAP